MAAPIASARSATILSYAGMCAIWGTTWLVIKVNLHYIPPITGVGLRFLIAGLALYAVAAMRGELRRFSEVPWKLVLVLAVMLFGLNYVLTYTAETRLDSGLVAVLFGTLPFFMFGMGQALVNERTTPRIWVGALVAFAGVALISLASQVQGSPLYALAAIGAAASSAFANVYAKRHSRHAPLLTLPPAMLIAGIAVGATGIAVEHPNWHIAFSAPSIVSLLYLALLGSGVAFFLNLWVLQRIAAWIVGLSSLIIPVIAVAVGVVFGGEHFTLRELGGSLLVIVGIFIALSQHQSAAAVIPTECEV